MSVKTATQNVDVSLALEFQKHLSNASRKHSTLDDVKSPKGVFFLTNREYHMQHNQYVDHQCMNIYCSKNQFPEL